MAYFKEVTTSRLASGAVTSDKLASGAVDSAALGADSIDGTKVADNAINSEHIAAGAVDDAHLAGSIALAKLATDPLARANHTGSQTASTISDFDTQVRTSRLDQMAAPTASVAMGSQKLTGLADGTAATDAVTLQQLQAGDNDDPPVVKSVSATLTATETQVVCDTTGQTMTLPASPVDGRVYTIKYRSGSGSCTINTNTKNVDGSSSNITLNPDDSLRVRYAASLGAGEYVRA